MQKFSMGTGATGVFSATAATSGVVRDAANGRRVLGLHVSTMHAQLQGLVPQAPLRSVAIAERGREREPEHGAILNDEAGATETLDITHSAGGHASSPTMR